MKFKSLPFLNSKLPGLNPVSHDSPSATVEDSDCFKAAEYSLFHWLYQGNGGTVFSETGFQYLIRECHSFINHSC